MSLGPKRFANAANEHLLRLTKKQRMIKATMRYKYT